MCQRPTNNVSATKAGKLIRPLRRDPTRTTPLQRKFLRDIVARFNWLAKEARKLIVDEDAFGLNPERFQTNTRYAFETDAGKVAKFQQWLTDQINLGVLELDPTSAAQPWTTQYIRSAYKSAAVNSFIAARPGLKAGSDFFNGSQAEFLRQAFDSPIAIDRVQLLATRSFENLKGITSQMSSDLNRIFADGVAHGRGPREIAREIDKTVDKINRTRAVTIARTEIVHTYAEGSLDSYERLGVEEVGILAEWSTAGDDRVCPQCAPLNGVIMSVHEARGIIPLHPNCRCAWLPYLDDRKSKSLRGKKSPHPKKRDKAIEKSKEAGAQF